VGHREATPPAGNPIEKDTPMRSFPTAFLVATLAFAPALPSAAFAEDGPAHPRVIGSGENASVAYGPGQRGNIVGGGRLVAEHVDSERTRVTYLDDAFAQQGRRGLVPVTVGSGEGASTEWVAARAGVPVATLPGRIGG
jgi:hypothetical protein